jgi:hypothetical protein
MSDAKVALANIADKIPSIYNTNEGRVVKNMKLEYVNRIIAIFFIIYQKNKVEYFSNKFTMTISKVDQGKYANWVAIMYFQLVKYLIKWEKCQKSMIEGSNNQKKAKKGCMP